MNRKRVNTVFVDWGTHVVGLCKTDGVYVPYCYPNMAAAIPVLLEADEVVTYNGWKMDLPELGKLAGLVYDLPVKKHIDMASICWGDWCYFPKALEYTYCRHFGGDRPKFPEMNNEYLEHNRGDVYMTFKLWELWKRDELKVRDGNEV